MASSYTHGQIVALCSTEAYETPFGRKKHPNFDILSMKYSSRIIQLCFWLTITVSTHLPCKQRGRWKHPDKLPLEEQET